MRVVGLCEELYSVYLAKADGESISLILEVLASFLPYYFCGVLFLQSCPVVTACSV